LLVTVVCNLAKSWSKHC